MNVSWLFWDVFVRMECQFVFLAQAFQIHVSPPPGIPNLCFFQNKNFTLQTHSKELQDLIPQKTTHKPRGDLNQLRARRAQGCLDINMLIFIQNLSFFSE